MKNNTDIFISEDKKTITLPVPLGTPLYYAWSDCANACYVNKSLCKKIKDKYGKDKIYCSALAWCHTVNNGSIHSTIVSLSNIDTVLRDYGSILFETIDEAKQSTKERTEKNQIEMKKLGFKLDDEGRCIN